MALAKRHDVPLGDQIYYSAQAKVLAVGDGFTDPFRVGMAAADHPPLTALVLAPVSGLAGPWTGSSDDTMLFAQRVFMAVLGAVAVVLVGLLARAVTADRRVGLTAAVLAAGYANFWMNDGLVMSETVATVGIAGSLWAAYHYAQRRTTGAATVLGLVAGVTVLARAEMALLAPLVIAPLVLWVRPGRTPAGDRLPWRVRWRHLAAAGVAMAVVQAPWVVYNLGRFEHPVLFSTNEGLTYIGANCDPVYFGGGIGFWNLDCAYAAGAPAGLDQSELSRFYRDEAFRYVRANADRLPVVVAARVGRVWSLYRPWDMVWLNQGEGREPWASRLGIWSFWVAAPVAVAGAVRLRRSGVLLVPLLAMPVIVTVVAAWFYGIVRFRVPAEVTVVVLAAVALVSWQERLRCGWSARRSPAAGAPASSR